MVTAFCGPTTVVVAIHCVAGSPEGAEPNTGNRLETVIIKPIIKIASIPIPVIFSVFVIIFIIKKLLGESSLVEHPVGWDWVLHLATLYLPTETYYFHLIYYNIIFFSCNIRPIIILLDLMVLLPVPLF